MAEGDSSAKGENIVGLSFWKKKCFEVGSERVLRRFLSERKGMVIPRRGTEDRKSSGTNSGKSGSKESGG